MNELDNLTIEFDYIFTEEDGFKTFGFTMDRKHTYNKDYKYVVANFVLQNGESLQDIGVLPEPDHIDRKEHTSINTGCACLFLDGGVILHIKQINVMISHYENLDKCLARLIYILK
jgi:hypothetical protein|nr:MAG TPA: hypothetical protein [Caudoviricetes sp.]